MQLRYFVATILFIMGSTQTENNRQPIKWFLQGNYLYYIETESKFTSMETQTLCRKQDLIYTIMASETQGLFTDISNIYGNFSSFWTYGNQDYKQFEKSKASSNACYKLTAGDLYNEEECDTLLGFICKGRLFGGTIRYKNGSEYEIGLNALHEYCDPQPNNYDDVLEYCAIHYILMLL